jgi:hypothetical protein
MLYKITGVLVSALDPNTYLVKKPEVSNIMENRTSNNTRSFKIPFAHTEQFKNSFFIKTLVDWNYLEDRIVHARTVEHFKTALQQD